MQSNLRAQAEIQAQRKKVSSFVLGGLLAGYAPRACAMLRFVQESDAKLLARGDSFADIWGNSNSPTRTSNYSSKLLRLRRAARSMCAGC
jgi:hypothetical protein